jgi:Spy/CpxP family protein refolding chaperone
MNEASVAKRKAAVWVAAVFLLGAALGGVVGYIFAHRSVSANAPLSEPQRRAQRVEQLTQELGLSNDQRQQLDGILSQMHGEYKALHEQANAQMDAQMDQARQKGRNEIRAILTPEQRPKFEEFLKHMDEERKRADEERKRNGLPPPGGR